MGKIRAGTKSESCIGFFNLSINSVFPSAFYHVFYIRRNINKQLSNGKTTSRIFILYNNYKSFTSENIYLESFLINHTLYMIV